jgi:hypothetical protein
MVNRTHFNEMRPQLNLSYIIKHLLGSAGMAVIYEEPGAGKTFFALWLALCVAADFSFFGRRVRRCGVIYIAAEAGGSIENRVEAPKREFDFPADMPFAAITSPINLCSNDADLDRLIAAINAAAAAFGMPVGLIVIDMLSRVLAGGNENGPDGMGAVVFNCDRIREKTGVYLALVHHSGKDASRGSRGHSLLPAAIDTEIEVTRDEGSKISTARVTKQRDLPTEGSFSFTLRQIELGVDQDSDPVTSCVVEEAESTDAPKTKRAKLPAAQRRALQLLADAVDRAGEIPPASNHIQNGIACVTEELWRRYCYEGGISAGDQEAKQKAFLRAAAELVASGKVGQWGQWVWLN